MSAQENTKKVQQMYEEFGKGHIAAVLDNLTPDVEMERCG